MVTRLCPGLQLPHAAQALRPAAGAKVVWSTHGVHWDAPAAEAEPAGHWAGADAPAAQALPAGHVVPTDIPVAPQ